VRDKPPPEAESYRVGTVEACGFLLDTPMLFPTVGHGPAPPPMAGATAEVEAGVEVLADWVMGRLGAACHLVTARAGRTGR
jgi:hypothetical protein